MENIHRFRFVVPAMAALLLFSPMFVIRNIGGFDFWWWMSTNLVMVIGLSLWLDRSFSTLLKADFSTDFGKKAIWGIFSAVILYLVFFIGNYLSRLLFDFAGEGIAGVYRFKGDANSIRIAILMLVIIGPGEEIFWRGFLQRHLQNIFGDWYGFLAGVVLYTGVHVFTGNLMLILAALFAGLFWGWMYMKYRSVLMNSISHTIWDITVFILVPFV